MRCPVAAPESAVHHDCRLVVDAGDRQEIVPAASSGSHDGDSQGRDLLLYPMYRDVRGKNETLVGMLAVSRNVRLVK